MSDAQDAVVGRSPSPSLLAAAVALVLKRPWRWLGLYLLWLLAVESLMFVPVVGFVLKLALAGITAVSLYHVLARLQAGEAPGVRELLFGFRLPLSSQLMLAAASLLPFAAGLVALAVTQGAAAVGFFLSATPLAGAAKPTPYAMLAMKAAMYAVSFAIFFLAVACASSPRESAGMQFANALAALRRAWPLALLLSLLTLGIETLAVVLSTGLPAPMGLVLAVILSIASLLVWLPLNLALTWLLYQRVSR